MISTPVEYHSPPTPVEALRHISYNPGTPSLRAAVLSRAPNTLLPLPDVLLLLNRAPLVAELVIGQVSRQTISRSTLTS